MLSMSKLLGFGLAFLALAGGLPAADSVFEAIHRHVEAHPGGEAAFSFDRSEHIPERSRLPIGVFDSGIGGLTVLEALLNLDAFQNDSLQPGSDGRPDLENERFIYLGDQANMPYGNYPAAGNTDFLRELILKDALFLLGHRYWPGSGSSAGPRFDKPTVKAIVIACNTATAYGLEDLRRALSAWDLPVFVVGVVEAGARALLASPVEGGAIGVLATRGTCASGVYPRTIERTLRLAGRDPAPVTQFGSAHLAALIEGDPSCRTTLHAQVDADVRGLLDAHLASGSASLPLRTIVLGCTHFPLILPEIEAAFQQVLQDSRLAPFLAAKLDFIDPAERTAHDLVRQLAAANLRRSPEEPAAAGRDWFFISTPNSSCPGARIAPSGGFDPDYRLGRQPGHLDREDAIAVPMTRQILPSSSRHLVKSKLPSVWKRLPAQ